jgi:fumarate hydratase subunit beta
VTTIQFPMTEKAARALRVGDEVSISGTVVTARDAAHKLLIEQKPDFIRPYLLDGAIYHCGPVMKKERGIWYASAAGPTTSIREEPYEAAVIEMYGVRAIIGKGGMGQKTSDALKRFGGVYLHAVGGAAVSIADSIVEVEDVFLLDELGVPEAFWIFRTRGMKAVVTMDSKGQSLHRDVLAASQVVRDRLMASR